MTDRKRFDQGYGTSFSTRPVGMTTYLLVQPYFDENKVSGRTTCTWHIELCGYNDVDQPVTGNDTTIRIDISAAAGGMVNVRNTGGWPFWAWTDY